MKLRLTILASTALPLLVASQENATAANTTTIVGETTASVAPRPVTAAPVNACTSSADCAEGTFCSTLSKTCEAINCQNWQAGAPEGEEIYSETPCTEEGADPGSAFCGWDGNCYEYDCENWYQYGPVEFTSYDPANPVELKCSEYSDGAEANMNSVVFGCRPYQPGNKAPEAKTWTHFFNQECLAAPRGGAEFKCYQNRPNTDYRDYQSEVSRLNPPSCDREIYDNEQPLYWYIGQARQERKGEVINYKQGRDNTQNGDSFNANLADKTFYAVVISEDDAPAQTFPPPTTLPPVEDSSAPSVMRVVSGLATGFVAFLLL